MRRTRSDASVSPPEPTGRWTVELHVDDEGFVRAPAGLVHRRLADVAAWPTWWAGLRVRPLPPVGSDAVWALELAGAPLRRIRVAARLHGWRPDQGFHLALQGELEGRAEFWLEDGHGGTVVHHVALLRTDLPRPLVAHRDYRRAIRRGLWGLKDLLHLEARTSAGLLP